MTLTLSPRLDGWLAGRVLCYHAQSSAGWLVGWQVARGVVVASPAAYTTVLSPRLDGWLAGWRGAKGVVVASLAPYTTMLSPRLDGWLGGSVLGEWW